MKSKLIEALCLVLLFIVLVFFLEFFNVDMDSVVEHKHVIFYTLCTSILAVSIMDFFKRLPEKEKKL